MADVTYFQNDSGAVPRSLTVRNDETATNSRANATWLIWRRKQLLGIRGLATKAGAPSPICIPNPSTPKAFASGHTGLPAGRQASVIQPRKLSEIGRASCRERV